MDPYARSPQRLVFSPSAVRPPLHSTAAGAGYGRHFEITRRPDGTIGIGFSDTVVYEVTPGGPAHQAGLVPGMRLLAVDGRLVHSHVDVAAALATAPRTFSVAANSPVYLERPYGPHLRASPHYEDSPQRRQAAAMIRAAESNENTPRRRRSDSAAGTPTAGAPPPAKSPALLSAPPAGARQPELEDAGPAARDEHGGRPDGAGAPAAAPPHLSPETASSASSSPGLVDVVKDLVGQVKRLVESPQRPPSERQSKPSPDLRKPSTRTIAAGVQLPEALQPIASPPPAPAPAPAPAGEPYQQISAKLDRVLEQQGAGANAAADRLQESLRQGLAQIAAAMEKGRPQPDSAPDQQRPDTALLRELLDKVSQLGRERDRVPPDSEAAAQQVRDLQKRLGELEGRDARRKEHGDIIAQVRSVITQELGSREPPAGAAAPAAPPPVSAALTEEAVADAVAAKLSQSKGLHLTAEAVAAAVAEKLAKDPPQPSMQGLAAALAPKLGEEMAGAVSEKLTASVQTAVEQLRGAAAPSQRGGEGEGGAAELEGLAGKLEQLTTQLTQATADLAKARQQGGADSGAKGAEGSADYAELIAQISSMHGKLDESLKDRKDSLNATMKELLESYHREQAAAAAADPGISQQKGPDTDTHRAALAHALVLLANYRKEQEKWQRDIAHAEARHQAEEEKAKAQQRGLEEELGRAKVDLSAKDAQLKKVADDLEKAKKAHDEAKAALEAAQAAREQAATELEAAKKGEPKEQPEAQQQEGQQQSDGKVAELTAALDEKTKELQAAREQVEKLTSDLDEQKAKEDEEAAQKDEDEEEADSADQGPGDGATLLWLLTLLRRNQLEVEQAADKLLAEIESKQPEGTLLELVTQLKRAKGDISDDPPPDAEGEAAADRAEADGADAAEAEAAAPAPAAREEQAGPAAGAQPAAGTPAPPEAANAEGKGTAQQQEERQKERQEEQQETEQAEQQPEQQTEQQQAAQQETEQAAQQETEQAERQQETEQAAADSQSEASEESAQQGTEGEPAVQAAEQQSPAERPGGAAAGAAPPPPDSGKPVQRQQSVGSRRDRSPTPLQHGLTPLTPDADQRVGAQQLTDLDDVPHEMSQEYDAGQQGAPQSARKEQRQGAGDPQGAPEHIDIDPTKWDVASTLTTGRYVVVKQTKKKGFISYVSGEHCFVELDEDLNDREAGQKVYEKRELEMSKEAPPPDVLQHPKFKKRSGSDASGEKSEAPAASGAEAIRKGAAAPAAAAPPAKEAGQAESTDSTKAPAQQTAAQQPAQPAPQPTPPPAQQPSAQQPGEGTDMHKEPSSVSLSQQGPATLHLEHSGFGCCNGVYERDGAAEHDGQPVWKKKPEQPKAKGGKAQGGEAKDAEQPTRLIFYSKKRSRWFVSDQLEDDGFLATESEPDPRGPPTHLTWSKRAGDKERASANGEASSPARLRSA
eukprot:TRINITY_DN4913_c1_g2_i1.p1 TRINITY_DN4913_c1_g2~~TRINITY_DN4913_c1_g2_i1.p1  ORF type:complete len:1472 (+),score=468.95 TRINITY_DN4913_c1_g2_i1:85-4416(+)